MTNWIARLWRKSAPVVEPATPRDAAALAQLHGASFHRGWGEGEFEAMLREQNTLVHRLRQDRKVIGFAASRMAAVPSGSLKYTDFDAGFSKYTVPVSPGPSSRPCSSTMWIAPRRARPTEPGCSSQSADEMSVDPWPSVPE